MRQRLLFYRMDTKAARTAVCGKHNLAILAGANKARTTLRLVQLAEPWAVPPARLAADGDRDGDVTDTTTKFGKKTSVTPPAAARVPVRMPAFPSLPRSYCSYWRLPRSASAVPSRPREVAELHPEVPCWPFFLSVRQGHGEQLPMVTSADHAA
jgi:hypothetical protein